MNEQPDRHDDVDGWPLPSREVLRDLDRPTLSWFEQDSEPDAWPLRVAA